MMVMVDSAGLTKTRLAKDSAWDGRIKRKAQRMSRACWNESKPLAGRSPSKGCRGMGGGDRVWVPG
jgi:hypothetical protein